MVGCGGIDCLVRAPSGALAVYTAGATTYHQAARRQMGPTGFFAAIWIAQ